MIKEEIKKTLNKMERSPLKDAMMLDYINILEQENQQLKKQKDDVIEYMKKNNFKYCDDELCYMIPNHFNRLLRMLGEIDD